MKDVIEKLAKGDEYVTCPHCDGMNYLDAEFRTGYSDYVACPVCSGTGEASDERAKKYLSWYKSNVDENIELPWQSN